MEREKERAVAGLEGPLQIHAALQALDLRVARRPNVYELIPMHRCTNHEARRVTLKASLRASAVYQGNGFHTLALGGPDSPEKVVVVSHAVV